MSTVVREVLLKFGVIDTGVVRGAAQAESALKRMDAAAVSLAKQFALGLASSLGLAGGVAGLAQVINHTVHEIDELQKAQLRLKLSTGDNLEEYQRLSRLISETPRGGLFDDNDVASAVAMAKVLDLSADEIERLLPLIKGMAIALDQQLDVALQNVAFAIETGQVRSLRQYGISLSDVERQAEAAFKKPIKDLDEQQRRIAILNAVMEKAKLFTDAAAESQRTFGGAVKVAGKEISQMLQDSLTPYVMALGQGLARQNELIAQGRHLLELDAQRARGPEAEASERMAEQNAMARRRAEREGLEDIATAQRRSLEALAEKHGLNLKEIEDSHEKEAAYKREAESLKLTVDQLKKADEILAARTFQRTIRPMTAQEALGPGASIFGPLTATQQAQRLGTGAGPGAVTAGPAAIGATGDVLGAAAESRLSVETQSDEELERARKDHLDRMNDLQMSASANAIQLAQQEADIISQIDKELADRREARQARAAAAVMGFLSVTDRAAEAAFRHEAGRQKSAAKIAAAAAEEAVAAVLKTKEREAIVKAAIAAGDLQFGRAAQYVAAAALAGAGAAALSAMSEANMRQAETERASSAARDTSPSREVGQRAFGLTFTRPVENVNITNAISINGQVQLFGTDQTNTMRELFDQLLPLMQEALTAGRLAA